MPADDQHLHRRQAPDDLARRDDAVQPGQDDVHQHHVGPNGLDELERLARRPSLTDDLVSGRTLSSTRTPSRRTDGLRPERSSPQANLTFGRSAPSSAPPSCESGITPGRRGWTTGRYGPAGVAQAWIPPLTCAHTVPAQQASAFVVHASPAPMHTGPGGVAPAATHTVAPGEPTHDPLQQSSGAEQPAPTAAQASRQVNPPLPSGRHQPPQHCAATRHGYPAAAQAPPPGTQRERPAVSALQIAPAQHSSAFMQISPMTRQRSATSFGGLAQRPTPSGPILQMPEQHVAPDTQRSCSG